MKKALIVLLILGMFSGCASTIATIDTAAAIRVAGEQNLANWKKATIDRRDVHDRGLEELEVMFQNRLLATEGGAEAVTELTKYRTKLAQLTKAKMIDLEDYALAVENAVLINRLNDNMIGIWQRWNRFLGRVPGVSQLRVVAEYEGRRWMELLKTKGTAP